jgi:hypothetical protein
MLIDPISLGVAAVSTGLNLFSGIAQNKAQQQEYKNQRAYQSATAQFNQWQSSLNTRLSNAAAQQQYWQDTVSHNQNLAYVGQMRNFELTKEANQAGVVGQTRAAAGAEYVVNSEAIAQQYQEVGMQEAVAFQQYQYRLLQQSSAYQALAQEGNTADRFVNDFARQMGDYQTLSEINEGLRNRQYKRDQLSQVTRYLSAYNSQPFYEKQQYQDPIAPYPPLTALLTPAAPSMTGVAPSGMGALGVGTSLLGGVNTYMSTAAAIKKL